MKHSIDNLFLSRRRSIGKLFLRKAFESVLIFYRADTTILTADTTLHTADYSI